MTHAYWSRNALHAHCSAASTAIMDAAIRAELIANSSSIPAERNRLFAACFNAHTPELSTLNQDSGRSRYCQA
jgi:hypothetical protein